MSSHRNRTDSAVVPSSGVTGRPPPRTSAASPAHASGGRKLSPIDVRPNRACAACHNGIRAVRSASNAACHSAGVANTAAFVIAGATQSGLSRRLGGSSGKSSRITGPSARSSSASAALITRVWNAGSSVSPTGRPSTPAFHSARGGRVFRAWVRDPASTTVEKPRSSSLCPSALTARVQRGQTGVSRTESIRSCVSCPAICATASSIAAGSVEPMTV